MAAATAMAASASRPAARPSGGSHSHSPSHDNAKKSPIAVASAASGGHSRSQKIVQRARRNAVASSDRAAGSGPRCSGAGSGKTASVTKVSVAGNHA